MKFGGSSVADASSMKKVCDIINSDTTEKKIVVVSACKGITNLLSEIALLSAQGNNKLKKDKIEELKNFHLNICDEGISDESLKDFTKSKIIKRIDDLKELCEGIFLLNDLTELSATKVISNGEYLSSAILSAILTDNNIKNSILNARRALVKVGENENITFEVNSREINDEFREANILITQGFIASDTKGRIISLGRGGSDYTASLIGAELGAEEIQIWSDVQGVLTGNPKIVGNSKTLSKLSFPQMRELSYYGIQVLHPEAIKPAIEKNIKVNMLNTFNPSLTGTIISNEIDDYKELRSISLVESTSICTFEFEYNSNYFIKKIDILKFLLKQNVRVFNIFSNEHEVKLLIKSSDLDKIKSFGFDFKHEETNILVLIGQDLSRLLSELKEENLEDKLLFGINPYCFLIKANTEESIELYKKIHEIIVN